MDVQALAQRKQEQKAMNIERAQQIHLPAIVDIYNEAIQKSFVTADLTPYTVEEKQEWFMKHDDQHPIFVVVDQDSVVGWYSLTAYREGRAALSGVREISYYVNCRQQRKGIGSLMLSHAIRLAGGLGVEHLIAIVLERNLPSIALLQKFDFAQWGFLPEVANFNGERCGHLYFGRSMI